MTKKKTTSLKKKVLVTDATAPLQTPAVPAQTHGTPSASRKPTVNIKITGVNQPKGGSGNNNNHNNPRKKAPAKEHRETDYIQARQALQKSLWRLSREYANIPLAAIPDKKHNTETDRIEGKQASTVKRNTGHKLKESSSQPLITNCSEMTTPDLFFSQLWRQHLYQQPQHRNAADDGDATTTTQPLSTDRPVAAGNKDEGQAAHENKTTRLGSQLRSALLFPETPSVHSNGSFRSMGVSIKMSSHNYKHSGVTCVLKYF